jgi:PBP1b-binding outer membrane lipoprotein LpoB
MKKILLTLLACLLLANCFSIAELSSNQRASSDQAIGSAEQQFNSVVNTMINSPDSFQMILSMLGGQFNIQELQKQITKDCYRGLGRAAKVIQKLLKSDKPL